MFAIANGSIGSFARETAGVSGVFLGCPGAGGCDTGSTATDCASRGLRAFGGVGTRFGGCLGAGGCDGAGICEIGGWTWIALGNLGARGFGRLGGCGIIRFWILGERADSFKGIATTG